MDFILLAQAVEPISGGAGWVGAGLLGLVLCWLLLKHLPDKDKMILNIIESRDAIAAKQREQHSETIKSLGDSIKYAVDKVTAHCKEELEWIAERMHTTPEKMEEAIGRVLKRKLEGGRGGSSNS